MSGTINLQKWLEENLSALLSFPVPEDMTNYILSIENERDVDDYLQTLLDLSDPRHKKFIESFKIIKQSVRNAKGYKKEPVEDNFQPKENRQKVKQQKQASVVVQPEKDVKDAKTKKKSKYVNLYSSEGMLKDVVLLKGRHPCDCQASQHRLINNCLKCGRIVCEQEGSGPCMFCNSLVCSNEEQQVINSKTDQSKKLYDALMNQSNKTALKQRDRLLEYDRTSERRTRVIDDEREYFTSSSVWLSPEERKKVQQLEDEINSRKHSSRLSKKVTLDFAGRQVLDETPEDFDEEYYQQVMNDVNDTMSRTSIHPGISEQLRPIFVDNNVTNKFNNKSKAGEDKLLMTRVQDKQYLEMSDRGACLSMHQPWASLLVKGIKIDEGRTWYTSHRGRLWIASASKTPSQEDIKELETVYRSLYDSIKFPDHYPTGCLLGCVDVADCLPQETYREKYPNGESDSPFVFVCRNPQELDIKLPVTGAHKIYKLESKIHEAAQKSLIRLHKQEAAVKG